MRHKISIPRTPEEETAFRELRAMVGEALATALQVTGTSLSELSRLVYGDDKQTSLIRRTIEGANDPHLVTLTRYALALDLKLTIKMERKRRKR